MEEGKRTQWYVIGMALSIVVVTLLILLGVIFTFVLTVDSGEADHEDTVELTEEVTPELTVEVTPETTPEPAEDN